MSASGRITAAQFAGRREMDSSKKNAAASIFDYAGRCSALQAERETSAAMPSSRHEMAAEFEHSFPFRETPDQLKTIAETKRDMGGTRRWIA